jgi:hypothetical protein
MRNLISVIAAVLCAGVKVLAKRKGQADRVIEFIDPKSELAKNISKDYWVKEETRVLRCARRSCRHIYTLARVGQLIAMPLTAVQLGYAPAAGIAAVL